MVSGRRVATASGESEPANVTPEPSSDPASERFFAFLRAINTGGRRLTNDQLLEPFRGLGLGEVAAYQAAGNVTFVGAGRDHSVLSRRLEAALAEAYGFETPVFIRTRPQLEAVAESPPFSDEDLAATEGRIQVAFLATSPERATVDEAMALVPEDDRVVFADRECYWLPLRGVSGSQLPVPRFERVVGPMTIRTLGTITRMLRKFG